MPTAKDSKLKNTLLNGSFGLIYQIVLCLAGFISRSLFLQYLGVEYLGLIGVYTNILGVLSLAELGMINAMSFGFFKVIIEDDKEKIVSLLRFYNKVFLWISIVIFLGSIGIMFNIEHFISNTTVPLTEIKFLFFLFALSAPASYFMASKRLFLYAQQKTYIYLKMDAVLIVLKNILQIISIAVFKSILMYIILYSAFNLLQNIVVSHKCNKHYPYLKEIKSSKLDKSYSKQLIDNVKSIGIIKFFNIGISSTDNLIISRFVSTSAVGIYANYALIMTQMQTLINQVMDGLSPSLGHLIVEENYDAVDNVFRLSSFISYVIAFITSIGLFAICDSFISWWIGPEYVYPKILTYLLIGKHYFTTIKYPLTQMYNVSGKFKCFLFPAFIEFAVNIIVSIILVMQYEVVGVFVGTTLALLISFCLYYRQIFRNFYTESPLKYFKRITWQLCIFIFAVLLYYEVSSYIQIQNLFIDMFIQGCISVLIGSIIIILFFHKTKEFTYIKSVIMDLFQRKRGQS